MKEIYSVKLPKHIVFGDPWYFERYSGEELNRLIVDVYPHSQYQARVVLEEIPDEENPDFMLCSLSIYMAPEQAMQTYLQDMVYESQTHTVKKLGVDTARYYLGVDDRDDIIRTGGDGYWGAYHEMTRMIRGHVHLDATILTIAVPDNVSMEDMRQWLNYFFQDVQQVENVPKLGEEAAEEQNVNEGIYITQ